MQIVGADPSGSVYSGGSGRPVSHRRRRRGLLADDLRSGDRRSRDRGERRRRVPHGTARDARRGFAHRRLGRHRGARRARGRARLRPRRRSSSCCCPIPAAATCRRSSTTSGCSTWASCAPTVWSRATCSRPRATRSPPLVLITPEEPVRDAITLMHETGVSQLVVSVTKELPLAAKEVDRHAARARAHGPRVPRRRRCSTGRSPT